MTALPWRHSPPIGLVLLVLLLAGCASVGAVPTPARSGPVAPATEIATGAPPSPTRPAPAVTPPRAATPTSPAARGTPVRTPTAVPAASNAAPRPGATPSPAATATRTGAVPTWLARIGGHISFLRRGALWRHEVATGRETRLLDGVATFALSADGRRLAFVRGSGVEAELWLADAEGGSARRLVDQRRAYADLAWSSRDVLTYVASARPAAFGGDFVAWGAWCASADLFRWDEAGGVQPLGPGCDPAWAPEGLRIAAAGRPTLVPQDQQRWPAGNALRLMNARGQNAWDVVRLSRDMPGALDPRRPGLFLHRPVWAPDGRSVIYARFVGYALACDHSTVERTGARERGVTLLGFGDWTKRLAVSADGRYLAVDSALCNAPAFGGYNRLGLTVLDLGQPGSVLAPPILAEPTDRPIEVGAARLLRQRRAHAPAWAPEGAALAHLQPPDWPGAAELTPDPSSRYNSTDPAVLVARDVRTGDVVDLGDGVDFDSPLAWSR